MAITLSQLRVGTRNEVKIDPRGKVWSDTVVNEAINDSIRTVMADYNFKWQETERDITFSTVSGQAEYDLPSQFVTTNNVRVGDRVMQSTKLEYIKEIDGTLATGDTIYYYIRENKLVLYPTPTAVQDVEMLYSIYNTDLVIDTDEIIFPDYFKRCIEIQASYKLFSQLQDSLNLQRAQGKKLRYREELSSLKLTHGLPDANQLKYKTSYRSKSARRRPTRIIVID